MLGQPSHHRLRTEEADLHYVIAGEGPPLILIHGFPQTWHQWRPIIARLADRFMILAPDLRGIGATPGPAAGYDKHRMAADVRAIAKKAFADTPAIVVGHDMGAFVAFAYALRYRALVDGLVLVDAPMPGTGLFDRLKSHPRAWHIAFHGARDIAELLVAGRERAYIAQFIAARIYDPSAISDGDIDVYAAAYAAPGAMRAAFEMYRALEHDCELNRAALASGKLEMPVVAVGGAASLSGPMLQEMVAEVAEDPRAEVVQGAGHWIPEERPDALANAIAAMSQEIRRAAEA